MCISRLCMKSLKNTLNRFGFLSVLLFSVFVSASEAQQILYMADFPDSPYWETGYYWGEASTAYSFSCTRSYPGNSGTAIDSVWSVDCFLTVPMNIDSIEIIVNQFYQFSGFIWNYGVCGFSRKLFVNNTIEWTHSYTGNLNGYHNFSGSDPIHVGFPILPGTLIHLKFEASVTGNSYASWEGSGSLLWNVFNITVNGYTPETLQRSTWAAIKATYTL